MTWESDYPHDSTTLPGSRAKLEAVVTHLPDAIAVKFAETNAHRLFAI